MGYHRYVILICIFLIVGEVDNFFIYLLAIQSSSGNFLFVTFAQFSFFFSLSSCSSLNSRDTCYPMCYK